MGNKITRRRAVIDERYTRPQGLYPCHDVDHKKLRRLILDSKLAPCYPGAEDPASELEECPICFLQYPSLNRSKCCTKGVCTECFLQMKSPKANRPVQCPFCKTHSYAVEYRGAKTLEEKGMEQAEEQKVIEAKIRMRQQELQDDEERGQRREEDVRLGHIRLETPRTLANSNNHPASVTPVDETEGLNWRPRWSGNADRHEQVCVATPERNIEPGVDPYTWWADGGFDMPTPFQQSAVPVSPNIILPSVNQQQTEMDFPTHRFPPGAPRSRHRDSDEFELDLEDIMVMEAIWLSIQEQGARHRFADVEEANRPSELVTEECFDSEAAGGLALAIAALAERQAGGGINTAPDSQSSLLSVPPQLDLEVGHCRAGEALAVLEDVTANESGRREDPSQRAEANDSTDIVAPPSGREEDGPENLPRSGASESEKGWAPCWKSLGDQQAEIGTSFASCSSSESELTWETPRSSPSDAQYGEHDEKVLLPDSFEERLMLAMALSIADAAEPSHLLHEADASSNGPLPQPTQ